MSFLLALAFATSLPPVANFDSALAEAAKGNWQQPALVEVVGFYRGRAQNFKFFASGIGIRDGREQVKLDKKLVTKVLRILARGQFLRMPEQFGGKPKLTNGPELRSLIRLRMGPWEKTVAQMQDGEQSAKFASLVEKLLRVANQIPPGVEAPPAWESLRRIIEGTLAQETLQLEFVPEVGAKRFLTFTVRDGWYELAFGDGVVKKGWLSPSQFRSLVKILLLPQGFPPLLRQNMDHHMNLRVGVLRSSGAVIGMPWTNGQTSENQELKVLSEVEEKLKTFVKELGKFQES